MEVRKLLLKLGDNDYKDFYFTPDDEDVTMFEKFLKKHEYDIVKVPNGFEIEYHPYNSNHTSYVSKVRKDGSYEFSGDYLYAKTMSKKTALKHLEILRNNSPF